MTHGERESTSRTLNTIWGDLRPLGERKGGTQSLGRMKEGFEDRDRKSEAYRKWRSWPGQGGESVSGRGASTGQDPKTRQFVPGTFRCALGTTAERSQCCVAHSWQQKAMEGNSSKLVFHKSAKKCGLNH